MRAAAGSSTGFQKSVALAAVGFTLGSSTRLVRFDARAGRVAIAADRERCLALLAIAARGARLDADPIQHLEAAARYWDGGDKALANLRLVFASLPEVRDAGDAARLRAAEYLLDHGMTPRELLVELEIDAVALGLERYDPDQPRVPGGQGKESGRWTDASGAVDSKEPNDAAGGGGADALASASERLSPNIIQVGADEPLKPGGIAIVPLPGNDPLDPQGLNRPLSLVEQQGIADAVNTILANEPADLLTLNPHPIKTGLTRRLAPSCRPRSVSIQLLRSLGRRCSWYIAYNQR